MQIQPCTVRLKDGREVLLRSPEAADAQALLDYMRVTSGETHFMARYPEECRATVEDNPRARHLYEKLGFQEQGRTLRAFRLKDGTYRDEIQMVKFL